MKFPIYPLTTQLQFDVAYRQKVPQKVNVIINRIIYFNVEKCSTSSLIPRAEMKSDVRTSRYQATTNQFNIAFFNAWDASGPIRGDETKVYKNGTS